MSKKIGFIGLGTMGKVMSRRLMAADYALTVWNRTKENGDEVVAAGANWADTPKDVAAASDIVFTMTSDAAASEKSASISTVSNSRCASARSSSGTPTW